MSNMAETGKQDHPTGINQQAKNMMSTTFLTGFPGFLGSALVERILDREPAGPPVVCLVQEKFRDLAEARAAEIERGQPGREGRVRLVNGDITRPDLGLGDKYSTLSPEIGEIYHLAAIYDLGVERDLAWQVNVTGTREMLRFAQQCQHLTRFHYVSTCYISGHYPGEYTEDDLSVSQTFPNYYAETKYLAEVAVQQAMATGIPGTIYRPAVVVGDSRTGGTQKYDGPYNFIQWILRQPSLALMLVPGNPNHCEANVVPQDYVVDAIAYLSNLKKSLGKVYQLCDPAPLTVKEMTEAIGRASGQKLLLIPFPLGLIKGVLRLPIIRDFIRVKPENMDYLKMPTRYRCPQTLRDLADSGIHCPPFHDYVQNMVDFMRAHPEIPDSAMV